MRGAPPGSQRSGQPANIGRGHIDPVRRGKSGTAADQLARRILIEVAWLWQKYQPASPLSHWYIQRTAGQSSRIRRIMLIALARKLAISLWRYVETGLVPEGVAIAKAKLRPA